MRLRFAAICFAALLLTGAISKEDLRSSLVTVEGTVSGVASAPAEGDLEVLEVILSGGGSGEKELVLLLAPRATLQEVDFQIEQGDEIQARIFPTDQGPAKVHKIRNLTRNTMLRLRTLHRIPLWDGDGGWQGGPGRGPQHGHGGSGSSQHGKGPTGR
jgi:hypothetical protein